MDHRRFSLSLLQLLLILLISGCNGSSTTSSGIIVTPLPTKTLTPFVCFVEVEDETLGIIVYEEEVLNDPANLSNYDTRERFRASDGLTKVEEVRWDNKKKISMGKNNCI